MARGWLAWGLSRLLGALLWLLALLCGAKLLLPARLGERVSWWLLRRGKGDEPLPPGYRREVEALRRREFSRLRGQVYADYAGAPPYSEALVRDVAEELTTSVVGNPHSAHGWGGGASAGAADRARALTLAACNARPGDYECVFTSGATGALRLVGEAFPWGPSSAFLHLRDNHTSVLGIRGLAAQHGAAAAAVAGLHRGRRSAGENAPEWEMELCGGSAASQLPTNHAGGAVREEEQQQQEEAAADRGPTAPQHLFAFPLESNFSGARYDLALSSAVQTRSVALAGGGALPRGTWRVLVDAAKAAGTAPPDLSAHRPDFVALSFYKMFGFPTGLGALLVRRDALAAVQGKAYFGGGTVSVALADEPFHRRRPGRAGLEDGTLPFLDIPALAHGFNFIRRLGGFPAVAAHAQAVAAALRARLGGLRHANGRPVCMLYSGAEPGSGSAAAPSESHPGGQGVVGQGPVVAFNVLRADGSFVGYREVENLASLHGILLRTGCLCNPGACAQALGLTAREMMENFEAGHVCWDDRDVIGGRPTGVVRASFGYASSLVDAAAIGDLVVRYFLESEAPGQPESKGQAAAGSAASEPATPPLRATPPRTAARDLLASPGAQEAVARALTTSAVLESITVYPIKGCPGFQPAAWPLGERGLAYDRHWALVDGCGSALTLRRCPALATLRPAVDLQRGVLSVHSVARTGAASAPLEVPLVAPLAEALTDGSCPSGAGSQSSIDVRVCGRTVCAAREGAPASDPASVASWFEAALGLPCQLVSLAGPADSGSSGSGAAGSGERSSGRASSSSSGGGSSGGGRGGGDGGGGRPSVGFANEAQLLVLSSASLRELHRRSGLREALPAFTARFRPNLVLGPGSSAGAGAAAAGGGSGGEGDSSAIGGARGGGGAAEALPPYDEDSWRAVEVGGHSLEVAGPCARCDVVCLDPGTGRREGSEPLRSLAAHRRRQGGIHFGVLMNRARQAEGGLACSQEPARPAQALSQLQGHVLVAGSAALVVY